MLIPCCPPGVAVNFLLCSQFGSLIAMEAMISNLVW
jgi:hypothetical protein